jgi:hypothetical protein
VTRGLKRLAFDQYTVFSVTYLDLGGSGVRVDGGDPAVNRGNGLGPQRRKDPYDWAAVSIKVPSRSPPVLASAGRVAAPLAGMEPHRKRKSIRSLGVQSFFRKSGRVFPPCRGSSPRPPRPRVVRNLLRAQSRVERTPPKGRTSAARPRHRASDGSSPIPMPSELALTIISSVHVSRPRWTGRRSTRLPSAPQSPAPGSGCSSRFLWDNWGPARRSCGRAGGLLPGRPFAR